MLHPVERVQLVAEANSTRSPDLKKNLLNSKKENNSNNQDTNLEKQQSRKENSKRKAKQEANSNEEKTIQESAPNTHTKETQKYFCKFCKKDGHKISTCRYKKRKEKALKQRTQAQKEKSESNFKEFLKQQLQMLIKEVKEALNPTIMLNEILRRFETHEDKMNKLKHHYEEQSKLKQDDFQSREGQKNMQPHKHERESQIKEDMQSQEQHHEQSTSENQHEDDYQYTWEKQMKNPSQNSEPEDAWGMENEHSSTGFGEIIKPIQNQEEEQQQQQQNQEIENEFTWEHEIAHSKNQTQNSEPEDAWGEETETPTGFEEAIQIPIKGIVRQRKQKKIIDETNKKISRSDQKRTKADSKPYYWYINEQERKNDDDPIISQAWIITSKNQQGFTARKLWLDKETKKPRSKEFSALQVRDFRRLNENETKQANREINILNK